MDFELTGRIALVAGGGRGIGRAVCLTLAREGADVAVLARTTAEVEAVAAEVAALGRRAVAVPADLTRPGELDAAVEKVERTLGAPTVLVLGTAALWQPQKLQFVAPEEIDRLLQTDLVSAVKLCRRVLPGMMEARFGRIVALGSLAAQVGIAGGALYATAKAGLEGLIRGLARDYGTRGVTANVVALGYVETERLALRLQDDAEARERLVRSTARRALVSPVEAADAVAFLCSARADAITGAVLEVTAGAHLNNLW